MIGKPTQEEIDAVAHFVEAVTELRSSPFFQQEYGALGISMREGNSTDEIEGRFPDQQIIQGALVPFRRVWHQGEVCYYARIVNILRRYVPAYRSFLEPLLFKDEKSMAATFEWTRNCGLKPTEVIDLWLNTRYHHAGRGLKGQFSRDDFDRFSETIGPVLFEFFFLQSFFEFGISLFNVLKCAEGFLQLADADGERPSFVLITTKDPRVKRSTPGYTPENDKDEHRVWRLRRRDSYEGISYFFEILDFSDTLVADLLKRCESFERVTNEARIEMERADDFEAICELEDIDVIRGCIDNRVTAARNRKCRRGFVGRRKDRSLVWCEDFLDIVSEQYLELRKAFCSQPFK